MTDAAAPVSQPSQSQSSTSQKSQKNSNKKGNNASNSNPKPKQQPSSKLRGLDRDSPEVRISKTLSWILRHGAQQEGLTMRPDGYVKVVDLLSNPKLKSQNVDLAALQAIVQADTKQRYSLISEQSESGEEWLIKANQGHSMKQVKLELVPVLSLSDIPSGLAIHGTDRRAWEAISKQGLSKMKRNHIHLAQGLVGKTISGMRKSATVFIYIDVPLAISDGLVFFLSDNGVVLTEGNEEGFLGTKYFEKVEVREGGNVRILEGWRSTDSTDSSNTNPASDQIHEKLQSVQLQ